MRDVCSLIWLALIGLFRSRASLQAEILTLRHQLNVLRRKSPQRLTFTSIDRLVFAGLYRLAPGVLYALKIVRPETVIRWHRAGFRAYWRWKSRPRSGRPKTPLEIRQLIREISLANPLWGAPRIHGELLKLGIDVGQTTVAKYMARGRRPPSQGWKTFLHNHADGIASMDLFVVPTISFRLLYGLLILHNDRRQILWLGVTAHPTAEWISHQLTEAYGWKVAPRYVIRDRDAVYGDVFIRRLRAMSIRDRPTAPRSPRQNGYCERVIGSVRRECLDHVVVFGERHLRHLLRSYTIRTVLREVLYRHHPWFGRRVCIHGAVDKDGFVVFRCTLEASQADRGLEVPAWMFDRTAYPDPGLLAAQPYVSIEALAALSALLDLALKDQTPSAVLLSGASRASHDQNRGETHG